MGASSDDTAMASPTMSPAHGYDQNSHSMEEVEKDEVEKRPMSTGDLSEGTDDGGFEAIKPNSAEKSELPALETAPSTRAMTDEDLIHAMSRRPSGPGGDLSRTTTQNNAIDDQEEMHRLMSQMFGRTRQENSEEENNRHVGVSFSHLTVRGMGLGAALQPSVADVFMDIPRFLKNVVTKGPRKAAGKPPVKVILDDFSGCVKPGEMLLVLGRPGSGCSTFLKVLGNQRFGYESIDGEVKYGGTDWKTMLRNFRGEVVYMPEEDLHYATLSVRNTLTFALKTRTPGKSSRNEGESRGEYIKSFLRSVTKLFWIEHTLDTKVGNEYVRGVSGGERKRVSIAEAMITKASIQCWDNSTRGLDASTAREYVTSLRSLTNMANISTAIALYQAGESLYNCFDKVLLIDGGRCAYFGSADHAAQYFKDLGFVQPERWTTADFLTSVTDEHERQVKDGWEGRIPRSADQLGDAFVKSEQYQRNLSEIDEFEREAQNLTEQRNAARTKATSTRNYNISFAAQVWACTHRQFLVMYGDKQSLGGKWGGILCQALVVGSVFYDMPKTSSGVFTRGGVLFLMLLFNTLLALAELTSVFQARPILLKHKSFQFYRPAAFAIAQTVVDIPLVFIQVSIFAIVLYFMSNLARTASQFFICLLFLFSLTMTMYAFFRAMGAVVGSLDDVTKITGVALQALIVYTGYFLPPSKMHPWFSWLRWINPLQYAFESLMANEFYDLEIQCEPPFLVPQGPGASPQYQSCTIQGSRPGSHTVSGADYIQVAFQYSRVHLWRNFGIICAFFLFFVALTAFGMEIQKPKKGGGAVTLYKRGQVPKAVEKALETGIGPADIENGEQKNVFGSEKEATNGSESDEPFKKVASNETVFTWTGVNYVIPVKDGELRLLQDVQGYVRPGRLTALMGASGAGKTTLLNTLAQRIRFGVVTGDFLIDGRPLPRSFQRSSGFAEQADIHEPTATVREALQFSAKLRRPREVPLHEKYAYCETVLELLEMQEIAGAVIGTAGEGLNQEQRKRLTIGIELASKPELLLFLDEPTSGLDSGAAFNIVRFLRKLADAGQAILCTIHQPSSILFEEFDELILLKSGGRVVYHGDLGQDSRKLIDYFESNGARRCLPKANPAEYMLETIGAGNPEYKGKDWGDVWASSKERQNRTQDIQSMIESRRNKSPPGQSEDDREYAMALSTQVYTVVQRNFVAYWRSPDYVTGKLVLHIFCGLFNSFTFWHLGNSQIDMQSRLFSIFMTFTIAPPLMMQLQPRYLDLRNLYQGREASSKIYSWFAFTCGAVIPELPYSFVAGTLYWCTWYWATWFPRDTYTSASIWLLTCAFEVFYVSLGQAIASFTPNELLASLLVPLSFLFIMSFCGVLVPYTALPYFWRSWVYWLSPFRYLLEALLALIVHDVPIQCSTSELASFAAPPGQTCESYTGPYVAQVGGYVITQTNGLCGFCQHANGDEYAASLNVYNNNVWRDYGIFLGFCMFNFFVIFLCSWLYVQGGRNIKRKFSPAARKEASIRKQHEQDATGNKV